MPNPVKIVLLKNVKCQKLDLVFVESNFFGQANNSHLFVYKFNILFQSKYCRGLQRHVSKTPRSVSLCRVRLYTVLSYAESDLVQCQSVQSWSPHSVGLRRVRLCAVLVCSEVRLHTVLVQSILDFQKMFENKAKIQHMDPGCSGDVRNNKTSLGGFDSLKKLNLPNKSFETATLMSLKHSP